MAIQEPLKFALEHWEVLRNGQLTKGVHGSCVFAAGQANGSRFGNENLEALHLVLRTTWTLLSLPTTSAARALQIAVAEFGHEGVLDSVGPEYRGVQRRRRMTQARPLLTSTRPKSRPNARPMAVGLGYLVPMRSCQNLANKETNFGGELRSQSQWKFEREFGTTYRRRTSCPEGHQVLG